MSDHRNKAEKPVKSPCISVCALNAEDICEGCFRTGAEISRWGRMSNEERRAVLRSCTERARRMGRIW
ncbi:DUF1289 domain-containing protein [Microbulbifer thermotolerans]|uniref:DUF1289 domain-containing protein n=1 Tax=Microbulbifer thermotolerans TaxID=252514 RepID=A0A143HMQ3_MICTH|nr:DUF1289 domain-containing protein [Microbulbifer thermotolerans]AMX02963.1 hypothetical protein A3224_10625 [Microbulbifer thermotolerans]MCX2779888.1 DUF1289 domain-containing protein [Microbulbifer thermotolerans]MCX2781593.1 DUF1289 domain-containing protein [Microbulbifer thermotolerans]MCX2794751.1 DUF1289 domain-containing protein [Microbulbifer thermotolerans]MCX2802342.1 DUF1289 domain-containing protein [Microbulbifer thermotolerans]